MAVSNIIAFGIFNQILMTFSSFSNRYFMEKKKIISIKFVEASLYHKEVCLF